MPARPADSNLNRDGAQFDIERSTSSRQIRCLISGMASLVLLCAGTASAVLPQSWKLDTPQDFLSGELSGLAVTSLGAIEIAPHTTLLHDPQVAYVWSLASAKDGTLYVGTGNDGKIFVIQNGQGRLLIDTAEIGVHALCVGPDGRLYAATAPEGKVYAIDAHGNARVFFDPADRYVWALQFDAQGRLYVATGNEGQIYRVAPDGRNELFFASTDTHITTLAWGPNGLLYAGSSPSGLIYRIDAQGAATVLYDAAFEEVRGLAVAEDGTLYAALVEATAKEKAPTPRVAPTPPLVPGPPGTTEITITEAITVTPALATITSDGGQGALKGAVMRLWPHGESETLWSSTEERPQALWRVNDSLWLGTGDKGRLYRVHENRQWTMSGLLMAEQVTAMASVGQDLALATANPGRIYLMKPGEKQHAVFSSAVHDMGLPSQWGRIDFEGDTPPGARVCFFTRSGNASLPDRTWSAWSAVPRGDAITSPIARYLQIKVELFGRERAMPAVEKLAVAYQQRNLRPQVQSVIVHPPGDVFQKALSITGDVEIQGLPQDAVPKNRAEASVTPAPVAAILGRRIHQRGMQTFSWRAEDPNGDELRFEVQYREASRTVFHSLRKDLSEAVLAWDTTTIPNGRYFVRVVATDASDNPAAAALTGVFEGEAFTVDNLPPQITARALARSPLRVRATAVDTDSNIRSLAYSVDGGSWRPVFPVDGLSDSREESCEFTVEAASSSLPTIVVQAIDSFDNVATQKVDVDSPR